jgi:hypothetical protein
METNAIFVVFLCVFLALTGASAIIAALRRLGTASQGGPDSALETTLFKWSAPAGLTYGVLAILLVIGIIKFWSFPEKDTVIVATDTSGAARATLRADRSESVIGSRVLITYDKKAIGLSELRFRGIVGASDSSAGPFSESIRKVQRGDQFFVRLQDHSLWRINVLSEQVEMTIEISAVAVVPPVAKPSDKSLRPTAQDRAADES